MIGIFDSGSGGLTVLRAVRERLPSADILYFGDLKNAPYGEKSRAELSHLATLGLRLLKRRGATSIVSACNSVAASLAVSLLDTLELPPERLVEMVGPTVRYLRHVDRPLLVAATSATVASGIYQDAFAAASVAITALPIVGLAGAIERGAPAGELEALVRAAFAGVDTRAFGGLVLACTHYPLAREAFARALPGLPLFDPAVAVAERVEEKCWPREAGEGATQFLVSADSPVFRDFAARSVGAGALDIEVLE